MKIIENENFSLIRTIIRTTTAILVFILFYRLSSCRPFVDILDILVILIIIIGFYEFFFVGLYFFYTYIKKISKSKILLIILWEYTSGIVIGLFTALLFSLIEITDYAMEIWITILGEICSVSISLGSGYLWRKIKER